ncbi:Flp pilus assembly protein TadD [Bradyrhizobium sp. LM3.2]
MSKRLSIASPPARFLFSALLILALGGCQTTGIEDITGALGGKSETAGRLDAKPDVKPDMDALRERYRAKPGDPNVALEYGKALRQTGQRAQALAVLEQAVLAHSTNKAVLAGYGRALADSGNFQQAFDVLGRAHSPEDPDWRILSAQGAALDQLGRSEEAQQYYATALKIVPEEPSVLSNLGLSLHAPEQPCAGRGNAAPREFAQPRRFPRARQPRAGVGAGRKAGRSRNHREGRSAAGSGGGKGHGAAAVAGEEAAAGGQVSRRLPGLDAFA